MSTTDPPPPADAAVSTTCPRCGAPLRPDQDWCLNCGAAVTTHVAGAPGWRTPVAVVGVVLVLAAVGLLIAFLELSDDADRVARAPSPTPSAAAPQPDVSPSPSPSPTPSPSPSPSPTPGATGPTGPTGITTPGRTPTPSPSPGSRRPPTITTPGGATGGTTTGGTTGGGSTTGSGTIASWPAGRDAWTVILKSASSKAEADKRARELQSQGRSVGVLNSSDYSSLRSGYWVVFSGQYDSRAEAQRAADGFKSSVPEAYARYVSD